MGWQELKSSMAEKLPIPDADFLVTGDDNLDPLLRLPRPTCETDSAAYKRVVTDSQALLIAWITLLQSPQKMIALGAAATFVSAVTRELRTSDVPT